MSSHPRLLQQYLVVCRTFVGNLDVEIAAFLRRCIVYTTPYMLLRDSVRERRTLATLLLVAPV